MKTIVSTQLALIVVLALLIGGPWGPNPASSVRTLQQQSRAIPTIEKAPLEPSDQLKQQVTKTLSSFTGGFLENKGQKNPAIRYFLQDPQMTVGFGPSQLLFSINPATRENPGTLEQYREERLQEENHPPTIVAVTFPGSNAVEPIVEKPTGAYNSHYYGSDPTKWVIHSPYYAKVVYPDLYEQIDLVYEFCDGQLKYEFNVYPGGSPEAIRVHWDGPVKLSLPATGLQINIETATGPVVMIDSPPLSYQGLKSAATVASAFFLENPTTYGFCVQDYDPNRPLIIDPLLSTFLGGGSRDRSYDLVVDEAGNVWVMGNTLSGDFPATPGAYDTTYNGGSGDVFVSKLAANGSTLLSSTFLGGSRSDDWGFALTMDEAGNIWVGGITISTDFPTTPDAFDPTLNGGYDGFVACISSDGHTLLSSTFLGGSKGVNWGYAFDWVQAIAADVKGNIWITGYTFADDFPLTSNAFDTTFDYGETFVTQLAANGSTLLYSTFLGGGSADYGRALVLDGAANVWITGETKSTNFPTTPDAFDPTHNGGNDIFITQLAADGSTLLYSTFLGGNQHDVGTGLALDKAGNIWITGETTSTNFPTTPDAFSPTRNGNYDGFVAQLAADGSALLYSTHLGGGGYDYPSTIALDTAGNVWITGETTSTNFPTTPDAFDTTYNGGETAFVTQFAADGTKLRYSTYLWHAFCGDSHSDLALNRMGNVWMAGWGTEDWSATPGAFDSTYNGDGDVILCELTPTPPQTVSAEMSNVKAVTLTWNTPFCEGIAPITNYRVYRSTSSGLYGSHLAETTEPRFIDWTVVPGHTYYYTVTAVHKYGEGSRSAEANILVTTLPSTPQSLFAAPEEDSIVLEWQKSKYEGAMPIMSYRIYRGTASGEYIFLGLAINPRFSDTTAVGGTTYYYVVTAVNELGESPFSNEVSIALLAGPSPPESLIALSGTDSIALYWNASRNDGGSAITFYRIHRGTTSGQYQFLGVTASTAFNDTTAEAGKLYYYVVTAVNAIGESAFSNEVIATTASPLGASNSENSSALSLLTIVICLSVVAIWARKRKER